MSCTIKCANFQNAHMQMASAFSATLQLESEGIFSHPDFEIFGPASVSTVIVGPSGINWNQSSLAFFPDVFEHPEATQVKFVFEASDADDFACQLDHQNVDCASPYTTPNLVPGEHVFQVTPVNSITETVCSNIAPFIDQLW